MTCRWTNDGHMLRTHRPDCTDRACAGCEPCTHDDHGNPVRHCRMRRRCTRHLADGEHTCPRCLAAIRDLLGRIIVAKAAMLPEAIASGVESEAASQAGPSARPVTVRLRRIRSAQAGDTWVEETDWTDPHIALGEWERAIREDLGHDDRILVSSTLGGTVDYLGWVLTDLAHDEQQATVLADLHQSAAQLAAHLEGVLRDGRTPEKGAPCPACPEPAPRLQRKRAHWCEDPGCEREHDTTGARDTWVCPADRDHWWTEASYRRWVADDYLANADRLTASQIEDEYGIPAGSVRGWASRGEVRKRGRDHRGRQLYDVADTRSKADRVSA